MKKSILLPVLFFALAGFGQSPEPVVQLINPSSVLTPKGYSQAAVIDLGTCKMVILSGQIALDKAGNLVGKGSMEKQAEQVFTNIKNIVEENGGSMNDLVKLGFYMTDIGQLQELRKVRDRFINTSHPPASTLVQVSRLVRDDLLLEVEATAVIPKR